MFRAETGVPMFEGSGVSPVDVGALLYVGMRRPPCDGGRATDAVKGGALAGGVGWEAT